MLLVVTEIVMVQLLLVHQLGEAHCNTNIQLMEERIGMVLGHSQIYLPQPTMFRFEIKLQHLV